MKSSEPMKTIVRSVAKSLRVDRVDGDRAEARDAEERLEQDASR